MPLASGRDYTRAINLLEVMTCTQLLFSLLMLTDMGRGPWHSNLGRSSILDAVMCGQRQQQQQRWQQSKGKRRGEPMAGF